MKAVLVTTKHRGVFFGYLKRKSGDVAVLKKAKCAIRWNTTGGFLELAKDGPNEGSRIGSEAPEIELKDVTSISNVTKEAEKAWAAK